ncbi:MAG TPA: hypothetical protein VFW28_05165 [Micropepsaceae bacterium]|nr:hypothetical protein [Micropepsaceae bacterium]
MKEPEEYRNYAEECRMIASGMRDAAIRAQMLAMAEQWDSLADEREKVIAIRAKLSDD